MRLEQFYEISESRDLETFRHRLVRMAEEMEFGLVTASMVIESPSPAGKAQFISISNAPEAYESIYRDADSSRRDPVLKRLKRLSVPFIYTQDTYTDEGAGDLWEEQAPYDYHCGISVAMHLPGSRHFLLGVDRRQALPSDSERLTRMMADLQLLAVHAQAAATQLLLPSDKLLPMPRLTPRELEVLQWCMAGKTAQEVGDLLKISRFTVNAHLRQVFEKLGVRSKNQAIVRGIALGILG